MGNQNILINRWETEIQTKDKLNLNSNRLNC